MKKLIKNILITIVAAIIVSGCNAGEEAAQMYCDITVTCSMILDNSDKLKPEKTELVPEDGIILAKKEAAFNEGENVLDIVKRELKSEKIHFDIKENIYIEGINNIYAGDCGDMSGWIYTVNGESPQVGCSEYIPKDGDVIEWSYYCE